MQTINTFSEASECKSGSSRQSVLFSRRTKRACTERQFQIPESLKGFAGASRAFPALAKLSSARQKWRCVLIIILFVNSFFFSSFSLKSPANNNISRCSRPNVITRRRRLEKTLLTNYYETLFTGNVELAFLYMEI